jgi:hypothetical protein
LLQVFFKLPQSEDIRSQHLWIGRLVTVIQLFDILVWVEFVDVLKLGEGLNVLAEWLDCLLQGNS